MFTNINNIFRVCVDNLKKLSYNVKRALLRARYFIAEMPKILLFVLLFIMAIILSVFNAGSAEDVTGRAENVSLRLEVISAGRDHLTVAIIYDGADELCGISAKFDYDTDILQIESFSPGSDLGLGGCLTYRSYADSMSFLLDSSDTLGVGELAVIQFSYVGNLWDIGEISLCGGYGNACVFRDGVLERAYLCDTALICDITERSEEGIVSANITAEGKDILLWGNTSRHFPFLGFDVTVTDIYGGDAQKFTVSSQVQMSENGSFFANACLPLSCADGSVIVIRPWRMGRECTEIGEETVFLLYGGKIQPVGNKAE